MAEADTNEEIRVLPLDENAPPIRERRLGAIDAWAGSAKQLVEETENGSLKVLDRVFSQSRTCSHMAATTGGTIDIADTVTIYHSAQGCTANILHRRGSQFWYPKEKMDGGGVVFTPGQAANWYGTNLTEEDVIFGGENKLRETIKMIDRKHHPKAIFISNSCAAGIMGDDLEGIINQVQPEVDATIVPVHCEAIRSRFPMYGYDAFAHALLKYLVKEPRKKHKDLINLLCGPGIEWPDRVYLTKLLARVGIRANVVPRWAKVEQIQTLAEAALSVVLCPTFNDYLVRGLNQKHGIPYLKDMQPFGIAKTEEWLRKVAQLMDKEQAMDQVIAEEKAAIMPQVEALRRQLQDLRIFVSGGQTRTFFLPHMLVNDFGMQLAGINPFEWGDNAIEHLADLGRTVGNMDFLVHIGDSQDFEMVNYLKKMNIDLALLHRGPMASMFKLGTPTVGSIFIEPHRLRREKDASLQMGFKGVVAYGRYLVRVVKNPAYGRKLGARVELPWEETWLKANAFSKLTENDEGDHR